MKRELLTKVKTMRAEFGRPVVLDAQAGKSPTLRPLRLEALEDVFWASVFTYFGAYWTGLFE